MWFWATPGGDDLHPRWGWPRPKHYFVCRTASKSVDISTSDVQKYVEKYFKRHPNIILSIKSVARTLFRHPGAIILHFSCFLVFFWMSLALFQRTPHMGRFFYPGAQAPGNATKPPVTFFITFCTTVSEFSSLSVPGRGYTMLECAETCNSNRYKHEKTRIFRNWICN